MIPIVEPKIEEYALAHTTTPPELLNELQKETYARMELPQMLTGPLEGRFLKALVEMLQAKRVIEVGTFTGYATLSMAEGLGADGKIYTCELDKERIAFAKKYFARSPHGKKIELLEGPAMSNLKKLEPPVDLIFIDADKENYPKYYEESLRLLRTGGFMAIDNVLWSGKVLQPEKGDRETETLHALNETIRSDSRVEAVLLTVRDGIQLVKKR
jgi:caffeoyl-CoA O-methyltransferase